MRFAGSVSTGWTGPCRALGGWQGLLLTSTAMWLTTAVWLGSRMSLVWWWSGDPLPPLKLWATGVAESCSTMKAPLTLILTLPGCIIVLSISAVVVAVLGLPVCSASTTGSWTAIPLPFPLPVPTVVASLLKCDNSGRRSVMMLAYRREVRDGWKGGGSATSHPAGRR